MKKLDLFIMSLLLVGGFFSLFLDDMKPIPKVIDKEEMAYLTSFQGRYVTTDKVARMIMENDPSLVLVDVRSPEDYDKFTIQGALNIPLSEILSEKHKELLDQDIYSIVLFSNGTSLADKAWLLLTSNGYVPPKVMKGGLNEWYKTILNPQKPDPLKSTAELERQYLFRKGAQIYFTGIQPAGTKVKKNKTVKPVTPVIKRKKKEVSGGCG